VGHVGHVGHVGLGVEWVAMMAWHGHVSCTERLHFLWRCVVTLEVACMLLGPRCHGMLGCTTHFSP
jgi:hypothetical protein